ncbi:hypothetical protein NPIL_93811, partial [Nephila pilipes]
GASYPLILDYSLRTLQCYFRKFLPFSSDTNRYRQWKRTMISKMKWITMKTQDPPSLPYPQNLTTPAHPVNENKKSNHRSEI